MKVIAAKNIGFCFGVERAIEIARKEVEDGGTVYTYGELIHNLTVIDELRAEGIIPAETLEEIPAGSHVIIRSHGVAPQEIKKCRELGLYAVDATCPFVKRIHNIVRKHSDEGYSVVIFGESRHPEVKGIQGWAKGAAVVSDPEQARKLPHMQKCCLVSQTTACEECFRQVEEAIRERCDELASFDTICETTRLRQNEAAELSRKCTHMFVIGGHHSSNTQKLCAICKKYCKTVESLAKVGEITLENIDINDIIGVVGGASTPKWIILEVIERMSELEKTMAASPEEEKVEAVAAAAVQEPVAETAEAAETSFEEVFSSDTEVNPEDVVKVGDEIEVEVIKVNDGEGNVLLSRKNVESKKLWDNLMQDEENLQDKTFDAVGKEVVKGGLIATINGIRAFIPASQLSTKYVENIGEFVGKDLKVKIIEVDKSRKRIVASHKAVMKEEAEAAKKELWNKLEVGSKVKGVVRRLTDFGAFVDIGGIDGLVHVTDVAWGRVKHPSDVLSIGQEIEVLIRDVDVEKQRVSLGYKQLQPKPWTMAAEKYPVGSIVEGKVVRIVPFGAFVALEPTIDGLIHISQVGVKRIEKVEDEINVGDVVRCKVLDVNPEAKRISLSRRDVILEENPEVAEQLAAEKAERERVAAERAAERAAAAEAAKAANEAREAERAERRRQRREENEYDLLPVERATTSLADKFAGFKFDEE